ncbi:MAG: glycosyltransferase family 2 protein [Clostridiales Family XIII bacterium]|nr:glycosyltransferase family 2 protein [Clostridiales Family XIII bacterium]
MSIITRTQGKRPAALREVFECLEAQSCGDFEILLMEHKITPEGKAAADGVLAGISDALREKLTVVPVGRGNRTAPLHEGFMAAKGRYISILDDDDIVYPNWVENFLKLEKNHAGKVLHCWTIEQKWESAADENGETVLRAIGGGLRTHCKDFDLPDQLTVNYCPPISLAFPAAAYQGLGIRFDESLTTTEDWDLLMRTVFACGIADIREVGGLYRVWTSGNAKTAHSEAEWEKNKLAVRQKFVDHPPVFTGKDIRDLIGLVDGLRGELSETHELLRVRTEELLATHERLHGAFISREYVAGSRILHPLRSAKRLLLSRRGPGSPKNML